MSVLYLRTLGPPNSEIRIPRITDIALKMTFNQQRSCLPSIKQEHFYSKLQVQSQVHDADLLMLLQVYNK